MSGTEPKKILVTAAGGHQGLQLIPRLVAAGAHVRALRASASGEAQMRDLGATEVIIGDARDPQVLARAVEGMDAVYQVCPAGFHKWEVQMGRQLIDAALAAGVEHFVYSSVLHPIVTDLIQHATKRDVEEHLVSSEISFTILQPADYMQYLVHPSTFQTGVLEMAWSIDRRQSAIDVADLAEVAAKVLLEGPPHYGATYELSGTAFFDGHELVATVARVTGREIALGRVAVEDFVAAQKEIHLRSVGDDPAAIAGLEFQMDVLRAIGAWYEQHDFVGNPNVLTWLLGRAPTTLEEYVRKLYAEVGGT